MKKKVLIAVYIILLFAFIFLVYFTFPCSYILNYNSANKLYKQEEYEEAIEKYKKALQESIPKYRECSIRINCALAICQTVEVNETSQESIESAIETYETAIDVLVENGCANEEDDNGHSEKAQQLKNDIQAEIDRLKKLLNEDDVNQNKNDNEQKTEKEAETIEDKIQDIKEEATKEQRDTESELSNYNKDYNTNKKNW